jgi:hypothetical protein
MDVLASVDWQTVLQRVISYSVEGIVVALAAWFIPYRKTKLDEVASIAFIAIATFALLDLTMGSGATIAQNARVGAGLGIGANLVGFPM